LTEDLQGGVKDPLLGSPTSRPDLGVVGERSAADDHRTAVGGLIAASRGGRELGRRSAAAIDYLGWSSRIWAL
jgi:hypothetical protein